MAFKLSFEIRQFNSITGISTVAFHCDTLKLIDYGGYHSEYFLSATSLLPNSILVLVFAPKTFCAKSYLRLINTYFKLWLLIHSMCSSIETQWKWAAPF